MTLPGRRLQMRLPDPYHARDDGHSTLICYGAEDIVRVLPRRVSIQIVKVAIDADISRRMRYAIPHSPLGWERIW